MKNIVKEESQTVLIRLLEGLWRLDASMHKKTLELYGDKRNTEADACQHLAIETNIIIQDAEQLFSEVTDENTSLRNIFTIHSGSYSFALLEESISGLFRISDLESPAITLPLASIMCLDTSSSEDQWAFTASNCSSENDKDSPLYISVKGYDKPRPHIIRNNPEMSALFPFVSGMAFRSMENPIPLLSAGSLIKAAQLLVT